MSIQKKSASSSGGGQPTVTIDKATLVLPDDAYEGDLLARFPFEMRTKIIVQRLDDFPAPAATALTKGGDHILIIYNPYLIYGCVQQGVDVQSIGIHEMYHYLYGHTHIHEPEKLDRTRMLVATDCEVNSYLLDLQRDPFVYPAKYKLPDKLRWHEYYKTLPEEVKNPTAFKIQFMKSDGTPDGDPIEVPGICSAGMSEEQKQQVKDALEKLAKAHGHSLEDNPAPPRPVTRAPVVKRVDRGIRAAIERVLGQELDVLHEKAHTRQRPHKWKADGYPGKRRQIGPKLAFVIDCSGSTSGAQQEAYYAITRRLLKEYKATVIEFDTQIRHVGPRPTCKEWGGGTDFTCVQRYAAQHKFDALIWFTDAEGPFDKALGANQTNIVILTATHTEAFAKEWGRVINYTGVGR